jgi:hypothetical protein
MNYKNALLREHSNKILMARRKKRLVDNTCVEDDELTPYNSCINGSD